jgi:CRISPR-associated Cas5-like protein
MYYGFSIKIKFSEAHFALHYTKGFSLSYPMPLPSSVAGIFATLLGVRRDEIKEKFSNFLFGSKLINSPIENFENYTYIQFKKKKPKGVTTLQFFSDVEYELAIGGSNKQTLEEFLEHIKKYSFAYLPFGGQNDFFIEEIYLNTDLRELEYTNEIENYAPKNWVDKTELLKEDGLIFILPVMHSLDEDRNFYFGYNVKFKIKQNIYSLNGVGLYELSKFYSFT